MVTSPNSPDAQTFAENDALPILETLETQLSGLQSDASDARFRQLDQLLSQFISQATQAQVAVLTAIATRLRAVLQQFHQHQQTIPVDSLIQQLLLQAHECLQLPITELSMFGEFDAPQAQTKAEPILQQLEARLAQVNPAFAAGSTPDSDSFSDSDNQLDDVLGDNLLGDNLLGDDWGLGGLDEFSESEGKIDAAANGAAVGSVGSVGDLIDDLFSADDNEAEVASDDDWLISDDVLSEASNTQLSDLELSTLAEPGLDMEQLFQSGFAAEEDDEAADWFNETEDLDEIALPTQDNPDSSDMNDWFLSDLDKDELDKNEATDLFADAAIGESASMEHLPVSNNLDELFVPDVPLVAQPAADLSQIHTSTVSRSAAPAPDLVTPNNLFEAFAEPEFDEPVNMTQSDQPDPDAIAEIDLSNETFEGDIPTERNVVTPGNLFEDDWLGGAEVGQTVEPVDQQTAAEVDDELLLGELFSDFIVPEPQTESAITRDMGEMGHISNQVSDASPAAGDADLQDIHQDLNDDRDDLFGELGLAISADTTDESAELPSEVLLSDTFTNDESNRDVPDLDAFIGEMPSRPTSPNAESTPTARSVPDAPFPDDENEVLMAALFAEDGAIAENGTATAEPISTVLAPRSEPSVNWSAPAAADESDAQTGGLVASFWHSPDSIADQGLIHLNRDRVDALNQQIIQLTVNQSWLHHQHQSLRHTIAELQLRNDSATSTTEEAPTAAQAMLTDATEQLQQMEQTLTRQQETISDLRDQWIDAQTLPIYQFFQRFPTWLSQSALTQQKPVQINIQAISARIDRAMLETLQDAIAQLLQYSIEYSIEPQEIRQRRGKPEVAQISLRMHMQGRQAIFELADDGWGLDIDAIRQDVAELGWGDEQTLADLSLSELIQQGMGNLQTLTTTTRQVSTLSLVQTRLQDQHGTLSATTTPGQGLTFTIQLPLPLIKLDGLLCQVNDQFLAFSAAAIEEIVVPTADQLTASGQRLMWRGSQIPVIALTDYLTDICGTDLAQQLDLPPVSLPETWHSPLLIVQTATQAVAIAVDAFVAQEALVIQALSPESAATLPTYIQGCAALRNGQQVVMVDATLLADQLSKTAIAV